jgi:hypothetical protein
MDTLWIHPKNAKKAEFKQQSVPTVKPATECTGYF